MKRLLKPTGSIYVHLDWHAVHYVKVEMDKIFGYNNFINEIAWCYTGPRKSNRAFAKKHDTILLYSKGKDYIFNEQRVPHKSGVHNKGQVFGSFKEPENRIKDELESKGKLLEDWWSDIWSTDRYRSELVGYPTQKPKALLERLIKTSTNENSVVADFFAGGGTSAVVAQELNRRWLVTDISRIAVEITKGRVLKVLKEQLNPITSSNIEVWSWGYYDISSLSKLTDSEFRGFIMDAFGARKVSDPFISGVKQGIPVWVGPKDHGVEVDESPVFEFATYLETYYGNRKKGIMIAWQFSERAKQVQEMLAQMGAGIDFVSVEFVPIGSDSFKKHIVSKSEDYSGFLRFILPPVGRVNIKRLSGKSYQFDFSESVSLNNGKIVNVQADFNFEDVFIPTAGFAINRSSPKDSSLVLVNEFENTGKTKIAFKIEDDQGGETLIVKELEVS